MFFWRQKIPLLKHIVCVKIQILAINYKHLASSLRESYTQFSCQYSV